MPCNCGFFHRKQKQQQALSAAFDLTQNTVLKKTLQARVEDIFGIKASKLGFESVSDIFTLMRTVGVTNVYNIVNDAKHDGRVKVVDIAGLKELLLAKTMKEAKDIYLKHAALYIGEHLSSTEVQKAFIEIAYPTLHDGLSTKKTHRQAHIGHLTTLGKLINAIPMLTVKSQGVTFKSRWDSPNKALEKRLTPLEEYQVLLEKHAVDPEKVPQKIKDKRDHLLLEMGLKDEKRVKKTA